MLGADSTTTYPGQGGQQHYYNHSQKLFELSNDPERGTLGAVTWGLGGLQVSSHRTLLAELADDIDSHPITSVSDAADRWSTKFWSAYSDPACPIAPFIAAYKALDAKRVHASQAAPDPSMRTADEEQNYHEQVRQPSPKKSPCPWRATTASFPCSDMT